MFPMRSMRIMLAPPEPEGSSISVTKPEKPAAFQKLILLMAFLTIAVVIGSLGPSKRYTLDKLPRFYKNSTFTKCR